MKKRCLLALALVATLAAPAQAGWVQPVLTVPAGGTLVVAVDPGVVWYGWHGPDGHGSEGRYVTVPSCPNGDEAVEFTNSGPAAHTIKVFVEPQSLYLKAGVRGTDDSITAMATCDPNAIPIPGGGGR